MKDLYRIAHKRKSDGQIVQIQEYFDLKTAQKRVKSLNERYRPDYEYFMEQVNLNSLSEETLLDLVQQEKLTLNDVSSLVKSTTQSVIPRQMSRV